MFKGNFFRSAYLRAGLELLAWEAATLVLAWLLFRWWSWMQRFSDVLFLIGILQLMAASLGMMGRPYEVSNSPWGVPPGSVHDSEQEKRWQLIDTLIQKKAFAMRLLACGALTFLLAVVLSYNNY